MAISRWIGPVLGLALAAGASAAMAQTDDALAKSVARGHDLVVADCSMCHAVGPVGDSPNPLSPPFRELHKRYPVEDLAEALAEGIMVGHPQMPQFKFGQEDVADIIHYLESIQTDQHAALFPHLLPAREKAARRAG
jgi:mono/diheme cytochrome c family protein